MEGLEKPGTVFGVKQVGHRIERQRSPDTLGIAGHHVQAIRPPDRAIIGIENTEAHPGHGLERTQQLARCRH